ncbi:hypothetical protein [Erwinia amylovora]
MCIRDRRYNILQRLRDNNPHPTPELNFNSPFELLIAVLLSAPVSYTHLDVYKRQALQHSAAAAR